MGRYKKIILSLLIFVITIVVFGASYLRSSLPTYNGSINFAQIKDRVEIIRDQNAIPHIKANNTHDLYFALGVVHAQDRLFQLEKNRRTYKGTLSEVFGEGALETDKFMRTLGMAQAAQTAFQSINQKTRNALQAYSDGVNAMVASHTGALPPEFVILGIEFEPWTPIDSLGWLKMMAFDLSRGWKREVNKLDLSNILTGEEINAFYPSYRYEEDRLMPDLNTLYEDLLNREGDNQISAQNNTINNIGEDNPTLGSNNWVVDGSRTETGMPLLANDPHLSYSAPAIWYMVHLALNGKNIVGVSLPAFPGVILGRNDNAAWGFTNTAPDVQDMFMERIGDNPEQYITPTGPENFTLREERIAIKGAKDITITIRSTRHGPVMSDILPFMDNMLGDKLVLSLRWTALDDVDRGANPAVSLINVRTFEDFVAGMSDWNGPEQNMIFANTDGDIGYFAPGYVPIRSQENLSYGLVPARGWDADFDWKGYIPTDELPRVKNPESGYVATANAKIVDDSYPHYITSHWAYPYRTERIVSMLETEEKHSIESFMAMQTDTYSPMAAEFLPLLLPAIKDSNNDIYQAFSNWDMRMERGTPLPLIYYAWHRILAKHIYADELGERFQNFWHLRAEFLYNVFNDKNGQASWCNDTTTEVLENCNDIAATAFAEAMTDLQETYGEIWQDWRWGQAHIARHEHTPFTNVFALREIFDVTTPVTGGPYTLQVNNIRTSSDTPFEAANGASFRAIYDLSNLENSVYIYPVGQSGNVLSPYYDHLIDDWSEGRYFKILTDLNKVRENNIGILNLRPAK
ncbi:MAG: penicillin acylase family protein [Sphingomonadales bacterium]|nr:penicillin acylase family protein [Sphingomonadales bacterium]